MPLPFIHWLLEKTRARHYRFRYGLMMRRKRCVAANVFEAVALSGRPDAKFASAAAMATTWYSAATPGADSFSCSARSNKSSDGACGKRARSSMPLASRWHAMTVCRVEAPCRVCHFHWRSRLCNVQWNRTTFMMRRLSAKSVANTARRTQKPAFATRLVLRNHCSSPVKVFLNH